MVISIRTISSKLDSQHTRHTAFGKCLRLLPIVCLTSDMNEWNQKNNCLDHVSFGGLVKFHCFLIDIQ